MPRRPVTKSQFWLTVAVLVGVLGFVAWDAVVRSRHVLAVSARYGVTVDAPATAMENPTGYADGRRSLVLPPGAADTAHWIMQTQAMIAAGEWRIRRVGYDNAPDGRELHWAAPLHWWLAGLAWVDHMLSGRPIGQSVERAVLYSGPVMFGLMLAMVGGILWRRFSPAAGAVFAFGAIATYPFYLDFTAGYADHHGLANLSAMLMVLSLLAGWTAGVAAPRWFTASAVAGGVGLWISTATLVPALAGTALGVVVAIWHGRRANPAAAPDPGLFRRWGSVGAGVSLAAYAVEYFPHHLGWRLEVNHPLYALAWLGAGELLRAGALAARRGISGLSRRDRVAGGTGFVLAGLLPLVIATTAERTFVVADPFIWRLHSLYISEFGGLAHTLSRGVSVGAVALCLPVLCILPVLVLAVRRSTPAEWRTEACLALLPALTGWLMGWQQVRWLGLAYAVSVPAMAVCFRALSGDAPPSPFRRLPAWLVAGLLVFLPGMTTAIRRTLNASEFKPEEIRNLAERDVAHWLRLRAGPDRVVVAGMPTPTTRLIFSGSLHGLGTLYWENSAGLKAAAALFAAPSPEAARILAARAGVTHVVLLSWDAFEASLARLARGLDDDQPVPDDSFAARLLSAPVAPSWLKPLAFPLPDHPSLQDARVRIWEVTTASTSASPAVWAANYYLEMRQPEAAARLVPLLERFPGDLSANIMLAGIAGRRRDAAAFAAAMERVHGQLPQVSALPLDDHLRLVVVFSIAGQEGPARGQLQQATGKLDERSLRQLSSGELADLMALMDGLGVAWPDPSLRELARTLLPPAKRAPAG